MSEHLKKITARAKSIRKKHPQMKWVNAVKQASKEVKHKPAKKAVRKSAPKKSARKSVSGSAPKKVMNVSIHGTMNAVCSSLLSDIGKLEARKFAAKTKTDKRKIAKTIAEKKKMYRKFKK